MKKAIGGFLVIALSVSAYFLFNEKEAHINPYLFVNLCYKKDFDSARELITGDLGILNYKYDTYLEQSVLQTITGYEGVLEGIKIMVKSKADVNYKDTLGMTALDYALRHGNFEVADYLISVGGECGEPFDKIDAKQLLYICRKLYKEDSVIIGFPERENSQVKVLNWLEEKYPEIKVEKQP